MEILIASTLYSANSSIDRLNISLCFREAIAVIIYFLGQRSNVVARLVRSLVETIKPVDEALTVLRFVLRLTERANANSHKRNAHRR